MKSEKYPFVSLHNVAETVPADWTTGGDRLCRVPASVGAELNDGARERVRHATGSEVRFVPESEDGEIEITLSAAERTPVRVFWGAFQSWEPVEIDSTPETLTLSVPDRLKDLNASVDVGRFDPRVCRVRFERFAPVALHDVAGDCRPPVADELPDRRYLAYGTSITEGAKSSAPHLSYVSHVARNCGFDALNLGCSGSAYCESAMAEFIADRDDWDVATLALSVNMANGAFSPAEFRERADAFVNTVAAAHPEKPVACVTLFPYFADATTTGDAEHAAAFREALRSVVADSPHDSLSLVEGPELLPPSELTWDVLHPGDDGMASIGDGLARHLETVLD
ncbi:MULTISPECIES: SGNH/GDSL hydrolase family protein [Halorussus]|uniref:SGNH/GDSL hydrolase family protein n=1 Tax=Halorussus TaxID=1070314 RepID=UPI0020A1CA9B|nr:GDSL-type esterase/lipase family protein [Halorussus vallis]USZ78390.1 GDSL-type esterase/lipase family protein [Halorussus vallis]